MLLREFNGQLPSSVAEPTNASVRKLFVDEFEANAPILKHAQFYSAPGSSDKPRKDATATGGSMRALNADFEDNATAPVLGDIAFKVFGDKIQTDEEYEARGLDVPSEHLREIKSFAQNLGRDFQDRFVNGIKSDTEFDGIKKLTPSSQLFTWDAAGDGTVPHASSEENKAKQDKFIEALDELIASIRGGAELLLMSDKAINRLKAIGRGAVRTDTIQNAIGIPQLLTSYNGIPIVSAGFTKSLAGYVLPSTEEVVIDAETTRTGCTSIYAMRFGEKSDLTFATNTGLRVSAPKKEGVMYTTRVTLTVGLGLLNDRALARLQGIKIS